jgi:hypothetical protein
MHFSSYRRKPVSCNFNKLQKPLDPGFHRGDDFCKRLLLCLPEVKEYPPDKIIVLRKKIKLSQAGSGMYFQYQPFYRSKMGAGEQKTNKCIEKII